MINDLENAKFTRNGAGKTAVNVVAETTTAPLDVQGYQLLNLYNEVSSVPKNVLTDCIVYIASSKTYLKRIDVSSNNISECFLLLNNEVIAKKRFTYMNFNLSFSYEEIFGLTLNMGDTFKVKCISDKSELSEFNTSIIGVRQ